MSFFAEAGYNRTIHDISKFNNPHAFGIGGLVFFNANKKLRPTFELETFAYLFDDKVYRLDGDGQRLRRVNNMTDILCGITWVPLRNFHMGLEAGRGFAGGQTLFGLKPLVGTSFLKKGRCLLNVAWIILYNRGRVNKENFETFSVSVGYRII